MKMKNILLVLISLVVILSLIIIYRNYEKNQWKRKESLRIYEPVIKFDTKGINEKIVYDFVCKTLLWNQYWFNKWDNKISANTKMLNIRMSYENRKSMVFYYVCVDEIKTTINLIEKNNYLSLGNISNYLFKNTEFYKYDYQKFGNANMIKATIGLTCKDVTKFSGLNKTKEQLLIAILTKIFTQNDGNYLKLLKENSKNGDTFKIRVGDFQMDYPDIYYYIEGTNCFGMVQKDNEGNLISFNGDCIMDAEKKYAISKINKNGFTFVWENNTIRYLK